MRRFHTLQFRLTMITALVLAATTFTLTANSIHNANENLVSAVLLAQPSVPTIPAEHVPSVYTESVKNETPEIDGVMSMVQETVPAHTVQLAKRDFAYSSYLSMILIIAMGTGITYVIVGSALKPVRELSRVAKGITDRNLSQKIDSSKYSDEISDLANSFNAMLSRLSGSFDNQKQFVANASHEFKTPLATIRAAIQVLKLEEEPTAEDYRETFEITETSVGRLTKVVDSLLELSMQQTNVFSDTVILRDIVLDVMNELKAVIEEKNLLVVTNMCEASVSGNQALIHRAVFNLVENAVKYNRPDGKIELKTVKEPGRLRLSIADTGIGIDESELQNIFQPFYRVDPSRSKNIEGYGLGLSLVKSIIEKHNGQLLVSSQKGVGTQFDIILPTGVS